MQGIRHYDNTNIDAVTNIARVKANRYYGERNIIDVEAAMLSNRCKAVKKFQQINKKKKIKKAFNSTLDTSTPSGNRKTNYVKSTITLDERKEYLKIGYTVRGTANPRVPFRRLAGEENESLSPNENQELDDWINLSDPGDVATKQTGSFGAILLKRTNMICLKGQTS